MRLDLISHHIEGSNLSTHAYTYANKHTHTHRFGEDVYYWRPYLPLDYIRHYGRNERK